MGQKKPDRLTVKDYAKQQQVTERTVRTWIVKGAVQVERIGVGRGLIRVCPPR